MFFPDHALVLHPEAGIERGLGKALSPHLFRKMPCQFQIHFGFVQISVGFDDML